MFFKQAPQFEYLFNQSVANINTTLDLNKNLLSESLSYFDKITDKKFVAASSQIAESINKVTDYAKENIKTSSGTLRTLFGLSK
jgi:hypothetical protein